jgi:hypothetical protein
MRDRTILIIIIIVLAAYFLYVNRNKTSGNQTYTIPPEYKGTEGLDYIRKNYTTELAQARNLCISQFKGDWADSSNTIGCYNMQGFSTSYCNMDIIQNIVKLCNSIGGNPICSSTQASCTV